VTRGRLSIHSFNDALLFSRFGDCCCVQYLLGYLQEFKTTSAIWEEPYVDRHYLDDFVSYYAKSFSAPSPHASRFHFFKELSVDDIQGLLNRAYSSAEERNKVEKTLQEQYLGFVVQRPLKSARIGRTVLRTYPGDGRRKYGVVRKYRVHLAGLDLQVSGLAYQQQDRGAAVCASTALWVALQRVAAVTGNRTPTPAMITNAARSPYPASYGLNEIQMASALSSLGYVADYFEPGDNLPLFRAKMVACIDSHLPVILLMTRKQATGTGSITIGHAVTVTGYYESPDVIDIPSPEAALPPMKMRSGSIKTVYVHDDNLGSHAHYELFDSADKDADGNTRQLLKRGRSDKPCPAWWSIDEWTVAGALVPKPEKVRLPVESLFSILAWLRSLYEDIVPGVALHFSARFEKGIDYKRNLLECGVRTDELRKFDEELTLPRHVGVISVHFRDVLVIDTLLDATEVERDRQKPPVLGFVAPGIPSMSVSAIHLRTVAKWFDVPSITAP
jgi:hypothetical protein